MIVLGKEEGNIENGASIATVILTTEVLITDKPEEKGAPLMPPGATEP